MEKIQPVIDWFTDRGGKRGTGKSITHYQDADNDMWLETDDHIHDSEIQYRGMQIFVTDNMDENDPLVELLYLLEHGRNDDDDDDSIEKAVEELETMLPEKAEIEVGCSIGTDVFLVRSLNKEELEPAKLDEIVTTLTKFAEFAKTKVSILYTAPEFTLKHTHLID